MIEDYAILLLDKEGNIRSWNKGAEKIKGYKQDEIIGKNFKIFYTEEDQKNNVPQKLIEEAFKNGKAVYEGWRVRKDKTMFWGSIVATALYNDEKELIGFSKVTRDLTEKKLAEEKLLQFNRDLEQKVKEQNEELYKNEKRFRALVENTYEAIALRNAQGELIYQSPGTYRVTGYTFDELKDLSLFSLFHPDDVNTVKEWMNTALQSPGIPIDSTHRLRHRSGHYIWIQGTFTNMLNDEHVQALVANFRDITERKLAEEKIMQANRLYAFVSAINQTIVYTRDEQTLYNEACRIAIEIGKFESAWISIPDKVVKRLKIAAHSNVTEDHLEFLENLVYNEHSPKEQILMRGEYFVINDVKGEASNNRTHQYALSKGFNSFISLPIIKSGVTIGSLNLSSMQPNIFDEEEIKLLKEVAGDISFALDVFEKERNRQLAEEKIHHSESRLKQAQSIANLGSWELDFATGAGIWSEEACRIYGFDASDNIHTYEQWLSFIHPDDLSYVKKVSQEDMEALSGSAFVHRIIRMDGMVRHVYTQSEIEYSLGIAVGLYGVVHDITDIKQAEDALQLSMTNLNLILDLIPQSVFVKNYDGKFIFVNKSFAALYGLLPEQMINRTLAETMPEHNDPDFFKSQDQEIIRTGTTEIISEVNFIDHTGRNKTFSAIKVPYIVPGTNEPAVLGITLDITEQKHKEAERTKMISDIMQRNKDLEQFSYIVSHNLRAPVANIIGLANMFQVTNPIDVEAKLIMDELSVTTNKLDSVIRDLNYILQIRTQVSEIRTWVRFTELLSNIQVNISNVLKDADVKIISDFSGAQEIFSIRTYLYSIFFNLISNSIKYRRSGVRPVIQISSKALDNGIQLIFADNGLGMDIKKTEKYIFGLYKRFHDHVEGKGIGLYMVKAQVETLGGKISVESEVNAGATFKIIFENSKQIP